MKVDFVMKRAPRMNVVSIVRVGPWREDNLKTEFGELTRWANTAGVRTGRWVFLERDHHRWEACLEVHGTKAPVTGRIRRKTLPATSVASVVFDPEMVSARIIYHALNDWLKWRKKDKTIRGVAGTREVYAGDPWKDPKAWSHCEVQFVLRR
jgi:effector-binding domain-containing protein